LELKKSTHLQLQAQSLAPEIRQKWEDKCPYFNKSIFFVSTKLSAAIL
jgi:hypothetical protein